MKKSYDYFKTFKILTEELFIIYKKTLVNEDCSSRKIAFFAEKSELLNNLQNEFITPFDRGDIFLLTEYLSSQLESVSDLKEYFSLAGSLQAYNELSVLSHSFETQASVFGRLRNFKGNLSLFEQCSDEVKKLNQNKKEIEKRILDAVYCKGEQPLVKYVLYSKTLEINRKIYKTLVETERILINNS